MQWIPRLCDCLTVTLTLRVVARQVPSDVALLRGVCVCVGGVRIRQEGMTGTTPLLKAEGRRRR